MRNSGAAIFLLPVLPVFLVFTFVCLCLPPFVFVVENPALPPLSSFWPRFVWIYKVYAIPIFPPTTLFLPLFLLPLSSYHSSSYHSLPPTVYCLFLLLCTVSSSYHSHSVLSPLCTTPSTQHSPSSYRKSLCKSCNVFAKTTKKGRISPYYQ